MASISATTSPSHPSRVRGLKFGDVIGCEGLTGVAPFTGAWIEIYILPQDYISVNVSHPSRVRGLKYEPRYPGMPVPGSHPSRVRGLKF